jgi:enhancer of polycomb-like protein
MDPYDTKALRFRATIPFPPHLFPPRIRQEDRSGQVARATALAPNHSRAISSSQLQAPS